jgi:hypothetical protein
VAASATTTETRARRLKVRPRVQRLVFTELLVIYAFLSFHWAAVPYCTEFRLADLKQTLEHDDVLDLHCRQEREAGAHRSEVQSSAALLYSRPKLVMSFQRSACAPTGSG